MTVIWETSLRIGTMKQLKTPEHYRTGADALTIIEGIDKNRYAGRIPLTERARALLDAAESERPLKIPPNVEGFV